jgi:hypothetical protein
MLTALDQADKGLCHESAPYRTEALTIIEDFRFFQNVVPQWRLRI